MYVDIDDMLHWCWHLVCTTVSNLMCVFDIMVVMFTYIDDAGNV